jgi:putative transposase
MLSAKPTGVIPNFINARGCRTGHLFQSRFASVVLDDVHLVRAVRHVSLNPVRARLGSMMSLRPVLDRVPHLKALLLTGAEEDFRELRSAEATGRPLGARESVAGLESLLGRKIARQRTEAP